MSRGGALLFDQLRKNRYTRRTICGTKMQKLRSRTRFYNEFLAASFEIAAPYMQGGYDTYFYQEREERWHRQEEILKHKTALGYIMSDNPSQLGYYLGNKALKKPAHIPLVRKHIAKLKSVGSYLEKQIKTIQARNDQIYKSNHIRKGFEEQKTYNDSTLAELSNLLE